MEPWTVPITNPFIKTALIMKKYQLLIFAALLASAAVSCTKETAAPEELQQEPATESATSATDPGKGSVVFTARMADSPATHSVIGAADGSGNYQPLWTESDGIIVNGVASTNTEILNGGLSARFTVEGVEDPFVALGPVSKSGNLTYDAENKTYKYLVNGAVSPQGYSTNGGNPTYSPNHAVIAAYSTGSTDLAFRHLTSYIKITVNPALSEDHDNIRYVYVRGGDKGKTAGYWTATYTDADNISIAPTLMSSIITLDCGEEGVAQGTPMIVAIPAYNYSDGLIITIKDVNGNFCSYSLKASAAQFADNAGAIVDFEPVFSPASGTINSAEDWEEFAAAMNSANDFDVYRWVGNGTVKLGSNISGNLTKITRNFSYTLDGQGNTITRSAAEGALFTTVSGSIKNLILDGTVSSTGKLTCALADNLYKGGSISGCTNKMSITVDASDFGRAGGLVGIMYGGTISGCDNRGDITVSADCSSENKANLLAGGIVSQVYASADDFSDNALLENCTNYAAIKAIPAVASNSYGIYFAGVGGIAGWARGNSHAFTFDNCDNEGTVTYSAENVTNTNGSKAYSINAGGIVGIAGDMAPSTAPAWTGSQIATYHGVYSCVEADGVYYMGEDAGIDITLSNCDNSGTVHNCGDNYSTSQSANNKVFTGGIAGSLAGTAAKHASLSYCTNTGTLLTYDRTGEGSSTRPGFCQVAGGLVGYGGYISADHCTVNCTIGNGKRASSSMAGAVGFTERPISFTNCTIWFDGIFTRIPGYNMNVALVAVIPCSYGSNTWAAGNTLYPKPNVTGSEIKNCAIGANVYYGDVSVSDTSDNSSNCATKLSLTLTGGIVRGKGYGSGSLSTDFTRQGNTTLDSAPSL